MQTVYCRNYRLKRIGTKLSGYYLMTKTKIAAYALGSLATWCVVASALAGSYAAKNNSIGETGFWAILVFANVATIVKAVVIIVED